MRRKNKSGPFSPLKTFFLLYFAFVLYQCIRGKSLATSAFKHSSRMLSLVDFLTTDGKTCFIIQGVESLCQGQNWLGNLHDCYTVLFKKVFYIYHYHCFATTAGFAVVQRQMVLCYFKPFLKIWILNPKLAYQFTASLHALQNCPARTVSSIVSLHAI